MLRGIIPRIRPSIPPVASVAPVSSVGLSPVPSGMVWVVEGVVGCVVAVVGAVVGIVVGLVVSPVGVVVTSVPGRVALFVLPGLRQPVSRLAQSARMTAAVVKIFTVSSSFFVFNPIISPKHCLRLGNPTNRVKEMQKEIGRFCKLVLLFSD